MILIVGEDQDALLYLRNRLNLAREENINDYLHAAVGTLGEEKVAVSCVGIGLSLVGINTATLLSVYDPYQGDAPPRRYLHPREILRRGHRLFRRRQDHIRAAPGPAAFLPNRA